MMMCLLTVLALSFLEKPCEMICSSAPSPKSAARQKTVVSSASVTSRSCDVDAAQGVVLFEGNVHVSYSKEFSMSADRIYMFLVGTNDVSRVVAIGGVTITNESRVGVCDMATYRRQKGEIEMLANKSDGAVRLEERGRASSTVAGSRILFWLDSEQVTVEDPQITTDRKKSEVSL